MDNDANKFFTHLKAFLIKFDASIYGHDEGVVFTLRDKTHYRSCYPVSGEFIQVQEVSYGENVEIAGPKDGK